jgi:hypothetical protein
MTEGIAFPVMSYSPQGCRRHQNLLSFADGLDLLLGDDGQAFLQRPQLSQTQKQWQQNI